MLNISTLFLLSLTHVPLIWKSSASSFPHYSQNYLYFCWVLNFCLLPMLTFCMWMSFFQCSFSWFWNFWLLEWIFLNLLTDWFDGKHQHYSSCCSLEFCWSPNLTLSFPFCSRNCLHFYWRLNFCFLLAEPLEF